MLNFFLAVHNEILKIIVMLNDRELITDRTAARKALSRGSGRSMRGKNLIWSLKYRVWICLLYTGNSSEAFTPLLLQSTIIFL